ncbi:MAG: heavy metal translocating P-type ATPase [Leptothrix sp. (in: b-proteobacteria)]
MPTSDVGSAAVATAPALTPTQLAAVDDADTLAVCTQWLTAADGRELAQSRLLLSGMHCAACSGLIETALQRVVGVSSAEVSAAAQRAVVVWDPKQTRFSALIEAARRAGYGAFPDTGAQAVALAVKESRKAIWRLFVAAFCMMQVMMYATPAYLAAPGEITPDMVQLLHWASWVLSIPVLVFAAGDYVRGAWHSLKSGRIGMDVPVTLGLLVTFVASSAAAFHPDGQFGSEVYFDSLTMFVSFLLGARVLETQARRRAAQSLDAVMRQLPDAVERLDAQGQGELVQAARLQIGDRVRVYVGQAFAADGVLLDGRTQVDESMLTGESLPVERAPGDTVSAGCMNLGAPVVMRVDQLGVQTRYQRIVTLVERALTQRPAFVIATDRLAGPFLWAVLLLALGAYVVWHFIDPARALWVAVAVLIVTCPCALSIGAPVALLAATGALARRGVLVQRNDILEVLTRAQDLVFDKTGTLTEDRLTLAATVELDCARLRPLSGVAPLAASLAALSHHPLARALSAAHKSSTAGWLDVREEPGLGMEASTLPSEAGMPPQRWRLGQASWCGASADGVLRPAVWFACNDGAAWVPVVRFEFDEALRPDAIQAVQALQARGLQVHLLSGDQFGSVQAMAKRLNITQAKAQCTPQDKLAAVEILQQGGRIVAMVGDGINDAPVLARADVSIAMGSAAALAQARADVIVLANRIDDLVLLRDTAVRTMRIVRQNLGWAVGYNLASVPLALMGWLPPWLAGIGMAASSLLVVLNALRLARDKSTPAVPASSTLVSQTTAA